MSGNICLRIAGSSFLYEKTYDDDTIFSALKAADESDGVGGILCEPVCGGKRPCFSSCFPHGQTYSDATTSVQRNASTTFAEVTGLEDLDESKENGNIEYGLSGLISCHKVML